MVQPEAHDPVHRLLQAGARPVEVRLLRQENVIVILVGGLVVSPGRSAEYRLPVGRRAAIGRWIVPHVPVAPGIGARGSGLLEPRMLVGRMVEHKIDQHADTALASLAGQHVPIAHGAVFAGNVGVVRNVVAEIGVGRRKERRQPDGVDAQRLEIVQALRHAFQVTDAIAVGVLKTARIDLVDHGVFPPTRRWCRGLGGAGVRRLPGTGHGRQQGAKRGQPAQRKIAKTGSLHCGHLVMRLVGKIDRGKSAGQQGFSAVFRHEH